LSDSIRIPVYCHLSSDYLGRKAIFHTLEPLAACARKYDPAEASYSHGASELLGHIIAPVNTEVFTDARRSRLWPDHDAGRSGRVATGRRSPARERPPARVGVGRSEL